MGPTGFLHFQRILVYFFEIFFCCVHCLCPFNFIFFFPLFVLFCVSYVGDFPRSFGEPWLSVIIVRMEKADFPGKVGA